MTGPWAQVLAAVLSGCGLVSVEIIRRDNRKTRRENEDQHAVGSNKIDEAIGKLDLMHSDVLAVRGDIGEIATTVAVHEHRLNQIEEGR